MREPFVQVFGGCPERWNGEKSRSDMPNWWLCLDTKELGALTIGVRFCIAGPKVGFGSKLE